MAQFIFAANQCSTECQKYFICKINFFWKKYKSFKFESFWSCAWGTKEDFCQILSRSDKNLQVCGGRPPPRSPSSFMGSLMIIGTSSACETQPFKVFYHPLVLSVWGFDQKGTKLVPLDDFSGPGQVQSGRFSKFRPPRFIRPSRFKSYLCIRAPNHSHFLPHIAQICCQHYVFYGFELKTPSFMAKKWT